jgi:hypothetical protein
MSLSVKCGDLISQFKGTESGDFLEWITKVELVAKIQKIESLHDFVPLFLSGGALAVYLGLSEEVHKDYQLLKRALTASFSVNSFTAYEMFAHRHLQENESIDVYVADLKRLAYLVRRTSVRNG